MKHRNKSLKSKLICFVLAVTLIGGLVLLGGCAGKSDTRVLYKNNNFGFTLQIPKDFMDLVEIKEGSDGVFFVNKEIQAMLPEHVFGVVGRIEIYDKEKYSKDVMQTGADIYGLRYLGENERYYFGCAHATDVQVPPEASQELKDKYRALEAEFDEIIKTFQTISPVLLASPYSATTVKNQVETAEQFVQDRGYTIVVNSGANCELQLPGSYEQKFNGIEIGALLKEKNELSKQNGYDFSGYLGKWVTLITYAGEGKNGAADNLDLIMDGNKIIGFWVDNDGGIPDFNAIVNTYQTDIYNSKQLLCYINNYDPQSRMLIFDEIEWVLQSDTKRIKELGLDAEQDFPNGYYIYNPSRQETKLKVSEQVKVYIVNWGNLGIPLLTDVNGLAKRMADYPAPYYLKINDGVIDQIAEQYRP